MIRHSALVAGLFFSIGTSLVPAPAYALGKSASTPYASCLERSAKRYNLTSTLLKGIVATESNWNPNARSHANAHGLMQIQWPGTARHLGVRYKSQLYRPCKNIDLGARYVRELLDRYKGDERLALAAYNYGPGRISADKPIPNGASKYVAKVYKNAAVYGGVKSGGAQKVPRVVKKSSPARSAPVPNKPEQKSTSAGAQALVAFSSRDRADRYVRLLSRRVAGASFRAEAVAHGRYQVWMNIKPAGLSGDEKLILASLGWEL